jgi:hypothetical protein
MTTISSNPLRYTLENFNTIIFDGFDYNLPEKKLEIISNLALQVGSPDYVRTPIFQKRENPLKGEPIKDKDASIKKDKRRNKECSNEDEWNNTKTFQTTKIDEKVGIDIEIDAVRVLLNKLTDKNYIDMRNKIVDIIDKVSSEHMSIFSSIIFDIASNNRFYSKIYADLYSDLSSKYTSMHTTFEMNLATFTELFSTIEYVDPATNYDKFCEINKTNERRKSLASFYLNLMNNGIISKDKIQIIMENLLSQLYTFISVEGKKNEVDELAETIAILYKKDMYTILVNGSTIYDIIKKVASSKVKDYKSLTNKTLFKFMDLLEM